MIKNRRLQIVLSIIKLMILIGITVAVPLYIYFYHYDFITRFKSLEDVTEFLMPYKFASIFIYIGLQAVQIIISVLPGQAFQFAAGYLYTFFPGLLFSVIGAVLGTTCSFYLAKILGQNAIHILFSEDKTSYYLEKLNSRRAYTVVFVLYLIPGFPKDIISYVAGISEMKFKPFICISLLGRLPGMCASLIIGDLYFRKHFVIMGIVAASAVIAFFVCIIKRKSIKEKMDKLFQVITR
ncbi:MAG: VTT domain-containing protein [Eubacteriaceae bacterium]|nr:VTT domain-containing protein [Eubacteriaceae bacterium]